MDYSLLAITLKDEGLLMELFIVSGRKNLRLVPSSYTLCFCRAERKHDGARFLFAGSLEWSEIVIILELL